MVNYLRISVTDRCNLRCMHCTPFNKDKFVSAREMLTFEEIITVVKLLQKRGIKHVRITGGEPLRRKNVEALVRMLRHQCALREISMTTNGILLREKLTGLVGAGLDRVNMSLNTLKEDRYCRLTGRDEFEAVFSSLQEAVSSFNLPVKINTVLLKGVNDDEIEDFAAFTVHNKVCLRFIEYVATNGDKHRFQYIPNTMIKRKIERKFGKLIPHNIKGNGPAVNYRISDAKGQVGFINTETGNFCGHCNRLRLTAEGRLYPCLFSPFNVDLKRMLREGAHNDELERTIVFLLSKKYDFSKEKSEKYDFVMSDIGG